MHHDKVGSIVAALDQNAKEHLSYQMPASCFPCVRQATPPTQTTTLKMQTAEETRSVRGLEQAIELYSYTNSLLLIILITTHTYTVVVLSSYIQYHI